MSMTTHKGDGRLETGLGVFDVAYVLTVTRSTSAEEGYGHVQAKGVPFDALLKANGLLHLVLENRGRVQIELTTCAGERAVFATTGAIADFLFSRAA